MDYSLLESIVFLISQVADYVTIGLVKIYQIESRRYNDMIKAIIFDKDGTIIDLGNTWDEPTIHAMNVMMELTDLSSEERTAFKRKMGVQATEIVPNSVVAAGSIYEQSVLLSEVVPLPVSEIELRLEQLYYEAISASEIALDVVEHVETVLNELKEKYFLGLVTNDNRRITEATLTKTGLLKYFDYVASANDFKPKPDPSALYDLKQKHGIHLDEMVYVGDSSVDMEYGKLTRAAIGLALDPSHHEHLAEADYIIETFKEIPALIEQINHEKKG